jgi:hypothetical protein
MVSNPGSSSASQPRSPQITRSQCHMQVLCPSLSLVEALELVVVCFDPFGGARCPIRVSCSDHPCVEARCSGRTAGAAEVRMISRTDDRDCVRVRSEREIYRYKRVSSVSV